MSTMQQFENSAASSRAARSATWRRSLDGTRSILKSPCRNVSPPPPPIPQHQFPEKSVYLDIDDLTAYTNQKSLDDSFASKLTDETANRAQLAIEKLARETVDAFMVEHDVELLISNSDCGLIGYGACAGMFSSAPISILCSRENMSDDTELCE